MHASHTGTFQQALDLVESLPESQRDELVEIVLRRRREERRAALGERIAEARREYERGDVRRGTVEDLLNELTE